MLLTWKHSVDVTVSEFSFPRCLLIARNLSPGLQILRDKHIIQLFGTLGNPKCSALALLTACSKIFDFLMALTPSLDSVGHVSKNSLWTDC